jgi:hypothetical protein
MKKTVFRSVVCLTAGLNLAASALFTSAFAQDPTTDTLWHGKAEVPHYAKKVFPPWQHGENNDATQRGFEFTVPEVDDLADFHGDICDLKLVLYVGGNYFFAMAPLVAEFEKEHPDFKCRVYSLAAYHPRSARSQWPTDGQPGPRTGAGDR